jgi:Leucine Rich repeat
MAKLLNKWKRFSLRSLFVLTTACCVFFGVWSVYVDPYRKESRALAEIHRAQGRATVQSAQGPNWQRWLVTTFLGDQAFAHVTDVELQGQQVDDAVLQSLTGLARLKSLSIAGASITDEGIEAIGSMKELQMLSLKYADISDQAAKTITTLPALKTLHLTGTNISDAAIPDLASLPQLSELFIRWTKISDAGARNLAAALPNCAVHHHALVD